jgi:hypothetical protein
MLSQKFKNNQFLPNPAPSVITVIFTLCTRTLKKPRAKRRSNQTHLFPYPNACKGWDDRIRTCFLWDITAALSAGVRLSQQKRWLIPKLRWRSPNWMNEVFVLGRGERNMGPCTDVSDLSISNRAGKILVHCDFWCPGPLEKLPGRGRGPTCLRIWLQWGIRDGGLDLDGQTIYYVSRCCEVER